MMAEACCRCSIAAAISGDDPADIQPVDRLNTSYLVFCADIDAALTRAAQNWQLRRMAIVDRNILRMAVYEMLHLEEVPAKVSINEAIGALARHPIGATQADTLVP